MTARFIGRGRGLILTCNHGAVSLVNGSEPAHFPDACGEQLQTGQIRRSAIRAYAATLGWFSGRVSGRQRDFCLAHATIRREASAERERVRAEKKAARARAKAEKAAR